MAYLLYPLCRRSVRDAPSPSGSLKKLRWVDDGDGGLVGCGFLETSETINYYRIGDRNSSSNN
jgi:hypothetical protein